MWLPMLSMLIHRLWDLASIPLVLLQYVPQILTTLSLRTPGSVSILSLALQIVVFVISGVAQFLRFGIQTFGSSPLNAGLFQSYFAHLHMSLNYILTAVGQLILLVVLVDSHLYGEIALDM
jgi:hypothetical protein